MRVNVECDPNGGVARRSLTTFGCTPCRSSRVACVCRRSRQARRACKPVANEIGEMEGIARRSRGTSEPRKPHDKAQPRRDATRRDDGLRTSKPVRSCNPRLGRFDSCAAPLSPFAAESPAVARLSVAGVGAGPLLLPGLLPEQTRVGELGFLAERLAREVDVELRGREVGVSGRSDSATRGSRLTRDHA